MKPAPFDYVAPRTVAEAVDHLGRHGGDARVLAGGQSLVRLMNTRLATPAVIVDINRVEGLDGIAVENGSETTSRSDSSSRSASRTGPWLTPNSRATRVSTMRSPGG